MNNLCGDENEHFWGDTSEYFMWDKNNMGGGGGETSMNTVCGDKNEHRVGWGDKNKHFMMG